MALNPNPWDAGGPPPVTPNGTDQGYAQTTSPNGVTAAAPTSPWYSNSAIPGAAGWTPGSGVGLALNANNATTSGQDASGSGAGFVPDWQFNNGQLMWRSSSHPGDHSTQESIMRAAAGYMQRGLTEKDAYDLATREMVGRLNQIGAAPSSYTILPYAPGMVQQFAQAGGDPTRLGQSYWSYMNGAATYQNGSWRDMGRGDLYAGAANGQNPNNQNPGGQNPTTQNPNPAAPLNQNAAPPAADPYGLTSAQKSAMATDPQMAFRYMMKQMGYNPDAPGLFGRFLQQRFEPGWESYVATQGLGDQGYADNLGQYMQNFTGALGGNGFDAFMRNAAQSALGNPKLATYLNALPNQTDAEQYLQQIAAGQNFGANPLVANALKSLYDQATNKYVDYSFGLNGGAPPTDPQMFFDWLRQQPTYGTIF